MTANSAAISDTPNSLSMQAPDRPERGHLELVISERGGRSIASRQFHQGALRVMRPHYLDDSGQVCYVMINPGGAYLGADLYTIDIKVQAGARLLLTTQSATKIYRTPGSFAEQRMTVHLAEGAQLELAPDQLIAYREARYRQNTYITVHPSSSLVMAEIVTPGSVLLMLDNQFTRPPLADVTGMGFMEGFSHLGSLIVVDPRVDQTLADELYTLTAGYDAHTGVSLTAQHCRTRGLVLRSLSNSTGELENLLGACMGLLRHRWHGQTPMNLRKY